MYASDEIRDIIEGLAGLGQDIGDGIECWLCDFNSNSESEHSIECLIAQAMRVTKRDKEQYGSMRMGS